MLAMDVQRSDTGTLPPGKEHIMARSISGTPAQARAAGAPRIRNGRLLRAVAASAAVLALAGTSGAAFAAASSPRVIVTGPDHQRLSVVLAPGHSFVFKLPKTNDPVRIDIASPSTNGGVQTPSEVFSALVNANANNSGMSWVGTSSDGSQAGNSTIHTTDIANLVCGANCVIAWLRVKSISAHTLILTANSQTSIIRELYVVNIWY